MKITHDEQRILHQGALKAGEHHGSDRRPILGVDKPWEGHPLEQWRFLHRKINHECPVNAGF